MGTPLLTDAVSEDVMSAVRLQIEDLQVDAAFLAQLAQVQANVKQLRQLLTPFPVDPAVHGVLEKKVDGVIQDIIDTPANRSELGNVIAELTILDDIIGAKIDLWIVAGQATPLDKERLTVALRRLTSGVRALLTHRPDVAAILDDLTAIKNLRGGPADAVAYHDFHVLQMAFKNVWLHAFDGALKKSAEELYELLEKNKFELNLPPGPLPESSDAAELRELIDGLQYRVPDPVPHEVWAVYGTLASEGWSRLSHDQQFAVLECAKTAGGLHPPAIFPFGAPTAKPQDWEVAKNTGAAILKAAIAKPHSAAGRLADLIQTISKALAEPYAFDVFAPNTYNYGLMITYRQRWEPGPYQAGDLAATIPLAPGETRKFSKKRTVKTARAVKEIEKSMSSRSSQSSETSRAEYDIMQRSTTATNFKMTTTGSFNIGIGSIGATSEFGGNQEQISAATKKGLHEATLKAAEEYRLERSLEIDTSSSTETEETSSGEISNPNNEITVTYLFYELQRRFKIREFLYRVRPVILVAQDVPAPEEINEGWLLQYQWILSRVLLDDSLRPALIYLNSGFAGDELAVEVKRTHWDSQRHLAEAMEARAREQLAMRDALRESLVATTLSKDSIPEMPAALKFFTFGQDPTEPASDLLEAKRKAIETRLGYAESALADAQEKLKNVASAFEVATKDYAAALETQYNRRVAIDQLRLHVKQNILFYMQAIWDQEPVDQRFFRLYKKKVICVQKEPNCRPLVTGVAVNPRAIRVGTGAGMGALAARTWTHAVEVTNICAPSGGVGGDEHELVEVADLDNPVGYKGNYIIFPLKHSCYLTDYMLTAFIDNDLGLIDPDGSDSFVAEDFEAQWIATPENERPALRDKLVKYLTIARRTTDEIIVPTGQLFIEALPGSHALLEDFKLLHRAEDVRKVKAEVRHSELENLRLAARLAAGEHADPDIEKVIVVDGDASVSVDTN